MPELLHYRNVNGVSYLVNPDHIIGGAFNRNGIYSPWEFTITLTNGAEILLTDSDCDTLRERIRNGDSWEKTV